MTGPETDIADALEAIAEGARKFAEEVQATVLPALVEVNAAAVRIVERISARIEANAETRRRRARMAAWEATDPRGRVAEMRKLHDAEARRLAARYGFPWPPPRPQVLGEEWAPFAVFEPSSFVYLDRGEKWDPTRKTRFEFFTIPVDVD